MLSNARIASLSASVPARIRAGWRPLGAFTSQASLPSLPLHCSPPSPGFYRLILPACPPTAWHRNCHGQQQAMPSLWGHSAQTTACLGATSTVPVGVQQPGKAWKTQPGQFFQHECDSSRKGNGKTIHHPPRTAFLGSAVSVTVMGHFVVWPLWAYFKICCPGRETKEAGMGLGGDLRAQGYSSC